MQMRSHPQTDRPRGTASDLTACRWPNIRAANDTYDTVCGDAPQKNQKPNHLNTTPRPLRSSSSRSAGGFLSSLVHVHSSGVWGMACVRACVRVGKNLPQPPSRKFFFAACPSDYRRTDGKMTPIRAGEIRGARREAYVERSEKEKTKKKIPARPFPFRPRTCCACGTAPPCAVRHTTRTRPRPCPCPCPSPRGVRARVSTHHKHHNHHQNFFITSCSVVATYTVPYYCTLSYCTNLLEKSARLRLRLM
jgi:hypothetical protein